VIRIVLAGLIIAVCVALLLRLLLDPRRRARFDAWVRRSVGAVRTTVLRAWRWPSARRNAARAAREAIKRAARRETESEGGQRERKSDGSQHSRGPRKPH
jgi:hypothetical protein